MTKLIILTLYLLIQPNLTLAEGAEGTLSERRHRQLTQVQDLISKNQYNLALEKLDKMLLKRNNAYEKALIYQTYAYIAITQEKYKKAIEYFHKTLEQKALPAFIEKDIQYNLAQLYAQQSDYKNSLRMLESWFKAAQKVTPQVHIFAASIYNYEKQYNKAIEHTEQAIREAKEPQESWYQLWVALYFEQDKYNEAIPILHIILQRYPDKKIYWKQLAGLYQKLEDMESALAILGIAYQRGVLDEGKDLLHLAIFYLYLDIPLKAAYILEKGLNDGLIESNSENWSRLADSWMQVRELDKAINIYQKALTLNVSNGVMEMRLARLLIDQERWSEAIKVLKHGLNQTHFKQPGEAYYLIGISAYYNKQIKTAKVAFKQANKYKAMKYKVKNWIKLLKI